MFLFRFLHCLHTLFWWQNGSQQQRRNKSWVKLVESQSQMLRQPLSAKSLWGRLLIQVCLEFLNKKHEQVLPITMAQRAWAFTYMGLNKIQCCTEF
jgi:hypothetical protein